MRCLLASFIIPMPALLLIIHCFRHTFATLQLASGTQITTIQKMLGHKNIGTTLVYAKTLEEAKREAADKIKILNMQ